jgi:HAD superfamily phosphatase (TIGR01668 family)
VLRPFRFASRISAISIDDLVNAGIRGLIVDLDDTLVGHKQLGMEEQEAAWITSAVRRGIDVVIVSNNVHAWVQSIAGRLNVRFVHNALKPFPGGFLRALRLLGTDKLHTLVIGDQVFTDVLGASLLGLRTILTDPLAVRSGLWMRLLRWLERRVSPRPR